MPPAWPPCSWVSPGWMTPAPKVPQAASKPPATTGVPSSRPVSWAAWGVTPPTTWLQETISGSKEGFTPSSWHRGMSHWFRATL